DRDHGRGQDPRRRHPRGAGGSTRRRAHRAPAEPRVRVPRADRAPFEGRMIALHLALKDLRLLARDPVALFWVFGFPVLFALFLGGVVRAGLRGETGPLELVVVDAAETPASR